MDISTHARRFLILISAIGLVLGGMACQPESEPLTPADTVRAFVQHLGSQNMAEARALCTPAKQAYLDAWGSLLVDSLAAPGSSTINILSLSCELQGDTAQCISQEQDAYETYTATYHLLRKSGRWLIHQPDSPTTELKQSEEMWPADSLSGAAEK